MDIPRRKREPDTPPDPLPPKCNLHFGMFFRGSGVGSGGLGRGWPGMGAGSRVAGRVEQIAVGVPGERRPYSRRISLNPGPRQAIPGAIVGASPPRLSFRGPGAGAGRVAAVT